MTAGKVAKLAGVALSLLVLLGVVAPYITADQYGERLKDSLERALGRRVDLKAKVSFSLLHGPAFRVDGKDSAGVVIHEDPSLGIECDRFGVAIAAFGIIGAIERRPYVLGSGGIDLLHKAIRIACTRIVENRACGLIGAF